MWHQARLCGKNFVCDVPDYVAHRQHKVCDVPDYVAHRQHKNKITLVLVAKPGPLETSHIILTVKTK